jgi:GNAT superfamily N-acetyltransferase
MKGIGRALMQAGEAWARERGMPVLSLDVAGWLIRKALPNGLAQYHRPTSLRRRATPCRARERA